MMEGALRDDPSALSWPAPNCCGTILADEEITRQQNLARSLRR